MRKTVLISTVPNLEKPAQSKHNVEHFSFNPTLNSNLYDSGKNIVALNTAVKTVAVNTATGHNYYETIPRVHN